MGCMGCGRVVGFGAKSIRSKLGSEAGLTWSGLILRRDMSKFRAS